MTAVINCHHTAALAAALATGRYVYVGREGHSVGRWGNRYSHVVTRVPGVIQVATWQEAVERHALDTLANPQRVAEIKTELTCKILGCWCDPLDCHAHTYAAICDGALD